MSEDKNGKLNNTFNSSTLSVVKEQTNRIIREMDEEERQRAKERAEINRCLQ